jgi:hypothetical protein
MTKHDFMTKTFKGLKNSTIINGIVMIQMTNDRLAKITFETGGTHGEYCRFVVKIINKQNGLIDDASFKCNDYLKLKPKSHPNENESNGFKVIEHGGWTWYINQPTEDSLKSLKKAMTNYVSSYENEVACA